MASCIVSCKCVDHDDNCCCCRARSIGAQRIASFVFFFCSLLFYAFGAVLQLNVESARCVAAKRTKITFCCLFRFVSPLVLNAPTRAVLQRKVKDRRFATSHESKWCISAVERQSTKKKTLLSEFVGRYPSLGRQLSAFGFVTFTSRESNDALLN